jgi:Golgi apparatus protein 1
VYLEYPESTSALVKKIAEVQRAAGLEAVLVDPYARSGSAVTVTGWVALLCMLSIVVVVVWGSVLLYRRVAGLDKPHTQYVKSGDA